MVKNFGNDITNSQNNGNNENNREGIISRLSEQGANKAISNIAGRGIIRVVSRCEDAKENNNLDLSECQLIQLPDAVFHLMRNTELKSCDLSGNVITKIPPKFALKFSMITELNLSHNQMGKLPDELVDLACLEILDISHNSFLGLPSVVFKIPKLRQLMANNNSIIDIDTDEIISSSNLELVNLKNNPLSPLCHEVLQSFQKSVNFKIELSERRKESWEDDDDLGC